MSKEARGFALNGAFVASWKVFLVAIVWAIKGDVRRAHAVPFLSGVALLLSLSGALSGLLYLRLRQRGVNYYERWAVAGITTMALVLLALRLLRLLVPVSESDVAANPPYRLFFMSWMGTLLLIATGAIVGMAYGRALRDPPGEEEDS